MADFKVGDCVKKVRGTLYLGHKGWVKKVFVNPNGSALTPGVKEDVLCLFVSGVPDNGKMPCGQAFTGYMACNWEKVALTGEDRSVTKKAPKEEMA